MSTNLYFLVGLPGSGKSDFARQKALETGARILSIGQYRKQWYSMGIYEESVIFKNFFQEIANILENEDCIVDASNLKSGMRRHFSKNTLRDVDCKKVCYVMATPYKVCLRNCKIDNTIVEKLYKKWETPFFTEGWDEIWLHYNKLGYVGLNGSMSSFPSVVQDYDQESEHHSLKLGAHLVKTMQGIECDDIDQAKFLRYVALIHDCGKPFTKSFENGRVRYYSHNNVGAYETMFFECPDEDFDLVYASALVGHHMDPFFWEEKDADAAVAKFLKRYGKRFYDNVMILHKADVKAK